MANNDSIDLKKNLPLFIVLISGAFITILNQTLLGTALPPIMEDLQLTESTVQWLQSVFMLVNGIMIPVTAFLIDRFTTRRLFLTAMSLFAIGTLIAAIAPNFSFLMVGRILQASGAGIMMPLIQTILFLMFPIERRGTAMGIFGLVIAFAPAIGPSLSGWLVDQFPWRSVFYVVLPIAIIDIIAAYFLLKNVTEQKIPKLAILLLCPSERRGTAMGIFGLVIASAPAIGPSLSGWLVDQFPWRSVFYVVLPIAIIDIIAAYFLLKNVTEQKKPKLDILSVILSTI